MSSVQVVTENAGCDVGVVVRGVFSTREKADTWIETRRAEYATKAQNGNAPTWGAPSYDVDEIQLDPEAESP